MAEPLIERLARAARERDEREQGIADPRLRKLVAGELTAAEEAALRAEVEAGSADRQAVDAFAPLGAGFKAEMVDALGDALAADSTTGSAAEVDRRRRPSGGMLLLAALLVIGFALAVALRWQSPAFGAYTITIAGAEKAVLSADDQPLDDTSTATLTFSDGNELSILAVPETPIEDEAAVATFIERQGTVRRLDLARHIDRRGNAFEIRAVVGRDFVPPAGPFDLLIVVGRAGRMPDAEALERSLATGTGALSTRHWRAFRRTIRVAPPG